MSSEEHVEHVPTLMSVGQASFKDHAVSFPGNAKECHVLAMSSERGVQLLALAYGAVVVKFAVHEQQRSTDAGGVSQWR